MMLLAFLGQATQARASWWMPPNASLHGTALDHQLIINLWILFGLFMLAHILLFAGILLQARQQPQPLAHSRWRFELAPLAAIAILFFSLAIWSAHLWASQRYTGTDPAAMQVEVVGMQFAWYFRYPGADAAFGITRPTLISAAEGNPLGIDTADERGRDDFVRSQLVLPAGREVNLRLRALDVIHGFAIPAMRVKQNAIPGQTFNIHFTPTVPGDYSILCTQVCGLGHAHMQAVVRILPSADFAVWLKQQKAPPAEGQP